MTSLLYVITAVITKLYILCFQESGSRLELGISTSSAKIISPNSVPFKAVKGAQLGSVWESQLEAIFLFLLHKLWIMWR